MKVLVTGADGLLGSQVVRELLSRGHAVRAFVQRGSDSPTLEGLPIEIVQGDLLDADPALPEVIAGCQGVVHCAAITDLWAPPKRVWDVNLEGTRRLADACLSQGVQRLVFVGSASSYQFGSQQQPGDEKSAFPQAHRGIPYMESKHAATKLVLEYVDQRGLDAVVVAPTFMLGSHDWRPSSGELIRQFIQHGLRVASQGGRSFAYVPDVAAAIATALERGRSGEAYILGGHNLSYREFFTEVAAVAHRKPPLVVLPPWVIRAAGEIGERLGNGKGFGRTMARLSLLGNFYSSEKAQQELDMPLTPVRTAIEDSLGSLYAYGHLAEENLKGKVALVTGGSRGVGFATAAALVHRGARVVITARTQSRLEDSRKKLESMGGEVESVVGDVALWEDAQRMVRAAVERFGRLDVLVNNAGVSMRGQFTELAPEVCDQTLGTNIRGAIYVTRAAAHHIVKTQGHIVFISSIAGLLGLPGASTYCASKGALTGLSESLRLELGPAGVHVGVVYLGFTEHDPEKRILAADGSAILPDRPAHHTQAFAAEAILALIEGRRRKKIMTAVGILADIAHRISPALVEWIIAQAQARRWGPFREFA